MAVQKYTPQPWVPPTDPNVWPPVTVPANPTPGDFPAVMLAKSERWSQIENDQAIQSYTAKINDYNLEAENFGSVPYPVPTVPGTYLPAMTTDELGNSNWAETYFPDIPVCNALEVVVT